MQYKKFSELPLETSPDGGMYAPIVDPTEPSVDDQNKRVLLSSLWSSAPFIQSGAGAVTRTVDSKLKDIVSVKDFIPSGTNTNTTDCSSYFQTAINAVGTNGTLYIPYGTYLIGNTLVLPTYIHIEGNNSTLRQADSYVGKLIDQTLVDDVFQDTRKFTIKDLRLTRTTRDASQTNPLLGSIGLFLESAGIILQNVRTEKFNVGVYIEAGQFGTAYSLKHFDCNVGLFIKSNAVNGGGNSWSFYDHQAASCQTAGVMTANNSIYPFTALYFRNPSWLSNGGASLAAFDTTLYIDGGAPEGNWTNSGSSTLTFDGKTIAKSSIYANGSKIKVTNFVNAEGSGGSPVFPFIRIVNNTQFIIDDMEGYGQTFESYISHDDTCLVKVGTLFDPLGTVDQLVTTTSMTSVGGIGILLSSPASVYNDYTLTNQCSVDPFTGAIPRGATPISRTTDYDANFGRVARFTFFTGTGNSNVNCLQFCSTNSQTNNNYSVLGVTLKSNIDATFLLGITGATINWDLKLKAGVATRVYVVCNQAVSGGEVWYLSAPPSNGFVTAPVVDVTQMMYITAPNTPGGVGRVNDVLKGAFNSNFKPAFIGRTATSIPTIGTWAVGDIVWNSAPTAGGTMGWVCTTGGAPGTFVFKTFGTIAV
jgi:hypothetical protein